MTLEFNKVQNVWEKKHFKKQQIVRKVKILELRNTPRRYFMKLPLIKGLKWMCTDDKKALVIKFNAEYCLARNEKPFSNYPELITGHIIFYHALIDNH